jgi:hypothetical protein
MATAKIPATTRFWKFVQKSPDPDGCWLWTGGTLKSGYLRYGWFWGEQRPSVAHRFAWEHFVGPIPEGQRVLHTCDRPLCVNYERHLFLGSEQDNADDRNDKGRQARGERAGRAMVTVEQVMEIRALHADGMSQIELAGRFGLSDSAVWAIVRRKSWTHI